MINILDGTVLGDQEITYEKNKESALKVLSLHNFVQGELCVVGYYTEGSTEDNISTDVMVALGVTSGRGPEAYRILADRRVVVVTSVFTDELPDVSTIVFDQRYVARDPKENKIYYLSRTHSQEKEEEIIYEKKEILDKCIIMDASTGDIYVCNPPEIVSFYDIIVNPVITKVSETNGNVSVEISSSGKTYSDLNFISSEASEYLKAKTFNENFEANITIQKYDKNDKLVESYDPCIVVKTIFTLEAKYNGEKVQLDIIPEGWTYSEKTGLYTKEVLGNETISSGELECTYTADSYTGKKKIEPVVSEIYKYFFTVLSETTPDLEMIQSLSCTPRLVSSVQGKYQISTGSGMYTWFCFPSSIEPEITQMGLSYVSADTTILPEVIYIRQVNLGSYTIYRSLCTGNGSKQNIIIS